MTACLYFNLIVIFLFNRFKHGTNVTITCEPLFKSDTTPDTQKWRLSCNYGKWLGTYKDCEHGDDGNYGDQSCVWHKGNDKVVTFYQDQELTEDTVELPAGAHLVRLATVLQL